MTFNIDFGSLTRTGFNIEFSLGGAGGGPTGQIKYWTGSAWVAKPVKYWTGSVWTTKPLKRWNGSTWITTPY